MVGATLAWVLLLPGQIETLDLPGVPKGVPTAAVAATVRVVNLDRRVSGSGVIIRQKGPFVYVLTAKHLIDWGDKLEVVTFSGTPPKPERVCRVVRALARSDDLRDLALLRVAVGDRTPTPLPFCPERSVPNGKGFQALTVGCSGGAPPTCQLDEVVGARQARREVGGPAALFWEVDRKEAEGRSGGALVDRRGYLLGICSGTNREKSYFCHTDEVRTFLKGNGFAWLLEAESGMGGK